MLEKVDNYSNFVQYNLKRLHSFPPAAHTKIKKKERKYNPTCMFM
jgi:hypothetical protein